MRVLANSSEARLGDGLLGRVIDAFGDPLDGGPQPHCPDKLALLGLPLNPMERGPINQTLDVGVKAINGLADRRLWRWQELVTGHDYALH